MVSINVKFSKIHPTISVGAERSAKAAFIILLEIKKPTFEEKLKTNLKKKEPALTHDYYIVYDLRACSAKFPTRALAIRKPAAQGILEARP